MGPGKRGFEMTQRGSLARLLAACLAACLIAASAGAATTPAKKPKPASSKSSATATKTYKWVDDQGVVHYGDEVPPEYAEKDRVVLNHQGVQVGTEQGLVTAAEAAAERAAAAEKVAAEAAAHRDRVLLSTYLSVDEIESLRDRRSDLLSGQIRVTENYLSNLRKRLDALQKEASAYKPYSSDPNAQPIEENLAQELSDTVDSIALYEKTLTDARHRQQQLVADFDRDIARFRELKGTETGQP